MLGMYAKFSLHFLLPPLGDKCSFLYSFTQTLESSFINELGESALSISQQRLG